MKFLVIIIVGNLCVAFDGDVRVVIQLYLLYY